MTSINQSLDGVFKVTDALNKKDYIQALILIIDMSLQSRKDQHQDDIFTYFLEQLRPALQYVRKDLGLLLAKKGTRYSNMKFLEKLQVLFKNYKEYLQKSWEINKVYFESFVGKVRSGEFSRKVKMFLRNHFSFLKK